MNSGNATFEELYPVGIVVFGNHPARGTWTQLPDNVFLSTATGYSGNYKENYYPSSNEITPDRTFRIRDSDINDTGMQWTITPLNHPKTMVESYIDADPVFLDYSDTRYGETSESGLHKHTIWQDDSQAAVKSAFVAEQMPASLYYSSEDGTHAHEFTYNMSHGHSLFKEDLAHTHELPVFSAHINSTPVSLQTSLGIKSIGIRAFMRVA